MALLRLGAHTMPSAFARDAAALDRSHALVLRSRDRVSVDAPALLDLPRWPQQPVGPPSPRERAAPAWQRGAASYTIAQQVQPESARYRQSDRRWARGPRYARPRMAARVGRGINR